MITVPTKLIIAECSDARAAEPGETCACGEPATVVFEPTDATSTAWCGTDDGEQSR